MEKYESENVKDDFVHVSKVTFPGGQQDSRDFGKDLQEITRIQQRVWVLLPVDIRL